MLTRLVAAITLVAALAAGPAQAADKEVAGGTPPAPRTPTPRFAPDRLIVVFDRGLDGGDRARVRDDADVGLQRTLGRTDFQLVDPDPGQSVAGALRDLRADPDVRAAARDGYDTLHAVPNDAQFGQLWGLRNVGPPGVQGFSGAVAGDDINAVSAWDRTTGNPDTVMADIDTGYRSSHEDLGPVAWSNLGEVPGNGVDDDGNGKVDDRRGMDFVGPESDTPVEDTDPTDDDLTSGGHGVHTAGTMGAKGDNGVGISGVSQDASIMPLRVCSHSVAFNQVNCPQSAQIAAINYAGNNGARVANMSLGGTTFSQPVVTALASNPGTLYVISAGNDGQNNAVNHHYPCDYNPATDASPAVPGAVDNVICVAATDQADGLASFSDYGGTTVDLGAPGTEILSTYPRRSFFSENFEGTGFDGWTASGANGGFARTNESPLSSFGITDTPGASPAPSTTRGSVSQNIPIPPEAGDCSFRQRRSLTVGAGATFKYEILSNGAVVFNSGNVANSGLIATAPIAGLGGTDVQIRFTFTTTASPASNQGAWIDDLDLFCFAPTGYAYLQGTSMAAPHVTGAAGLLFSLAPGATVTQVRSALLASVDPVASLSGKTTTGGRLDVSAALNQLSPPGSLTPFPPGPVAALGAAPNGTGAVTLDWLDTTSASGYEVFRRNANGTYPTSPSGTSTTSAFSDTGRSAGTTYCYRVRAVGSAGAGPMSGERCATTAVVASAATNAGATAHALSPLITAILLDLGPAPKSVVVSQTGRFTYTFTGLGSGKGTVTITTLKAVAGKKAKKKKKKLVVATKSFTAPAGGKVKLSMQLTGKGLRALKKARRLGTSVKVTLGSRQATRSLTLSAPKAKKKKRR